MHDIQEATLCHRFGWVRVGPAPTRKCVPVHVVASTRSLHSLESTGPTTRKMFNPKRIVIDAFVTRLVSGFERAYPRVDHSQVCLLEQAARMSLESLTNSDCSYHDLDHTIMVTDV